MTRDEARIFAASWLPAWTGNHPELLISFYASDAFYLDPAEPQGLKGREAIMAHFVKLLARNPEWTWQQLEAIPMEMGFVNKWLARIPVGYQLLEIKGVCLVQINTDGLIQRNEVYFDRSSWLDCLKAAKPKGN
ncbi:hypothetical protein GCM10009092_43880 [Bowmanella denitrificans]|uniref:SnoaL-like domain-containing protein n=1 Tax=Bowmanella denitrificans TaxID=366582 RepID=A0ABN0XWI2_9ALTE|nr:nuclear transport factor 2 family protein [Bowmanella denitrificans]